MKNTPNNESYHSYVITLMNNPDSVRVANRCIESGADNGITIEMHEARTPEDYSLDANLDGINYDNFDERWSRTDNARAAFYSHFELWKLAVISKKPVLIFEHDAVVLQPFPDYIIPSIKGCVNIGAPSYGKYNHPPTLGLANLFSKPYFPGAHAYMVTPQGAQTLISQASVRAKPTDVYLTVDTFPWLQEYSPYVAEVRDTFSTIQNKNGIQAKHSYQKMKKRGKEYKLL